MIDEQFAGLEALLFIHGEPLPFQKIGKILGLPVEEARALAQSLGERLTTSDRGLALVIDEERAQLVTKPQFSNVVENFVKAELSEDLSPASLETLAIVAYFGPISRSRIDYQRGVNSSFILRSLLIRGLVERHPDPAHQNTFLYQPSFDLLRYLGLGGQSALPEYERFRKLLADFEAQTQASVPVPEPSSAPAATTSTDGFEVILPPLSPETPPSAAETQ